MKFNSLGFATEASAVDLPPICHPSCRGRRFALFSFGLQAPKALSKIAAAPLSAGLEHPPPLDEIARQDHGQGRAAAEAEARWIARSGRLAVAHMPLAHDGFQRLNRGRGQARAVLGSAGPWVTKRDHGLALLA